MTRPILHAARLGRTWHVCFAGRYGVGDTFSAALAAAQFAN